MEATPLNRDFHTNAVLFRCLFWPIADGLRPDLRGLCCSHCDSGRRKTQGKATHSDGRY